MKSEKPLRLYEEIVLLALRNEQGTFAAGYVEHAVAGAVLAELLIDRRISIDSTRKHLVEIHNARPTGDPILDESLERMVASKRRASVATWIARLAGIKQLRHKVARQLSDRGILRADEDKVLFVFTRRIYPEINPVPEKNLVDRLEAAIFSEAGPLDGPTVVLISLASGADLLAKTFGARKIRSRKKRIAQIVNGELIGKATKETIAACQAAVFAAAVLPAVIASTHH